MKTKSPSRSLTLLLLNLKNKKTVNQNLNPIAAKQPEKKVSKKEKKKKELEDIDSILNELGSKWLG